MNFVTYFLSHPVFLVGAGGAIGSTLRYGFGYWLGQIATPFQLPIATTTVNILGSLVLGCIAGGVSDKTQSVYLLLGVGFCGGFTTFSALSLELVEHLQRGRIGLALLEGSLNLFLGVGALYGGLWLSQVKS